MIKSETIGELAKALCVVQGKLTGAKKDSTNPFYKSSYADLSSVWEACRELLTTNGLSVVQTNTPSGAETTTIDTTLLHISGEWISGSLEVPLVKSDPQGLGSAMTYARRYALSAIVGVCPEDDDAEKATVRPKEPAKAPQKETQNTGLATKVDRKKVFDTAIQHGWDNDKVLDLIVTKFQVSDTEHLTPEQCKELTQAIIDKTEKGG